MHCKRFLETCSVLLVAFSCLFLACFTKAWADTGNTTTTDYIMSLYLGGPTDDPPRVSEPVNVPGAGKVGSRKLNTRTDMSPAFPIKVESNFFKPIGHEIFLYVNISIESDQQVDCTGNSNKYNTLYWQNNMQGAGDNTLQNGVYYLSFAKAGTHNQGGIFRISLPATATKIRFDTPATYKWKGAGLLSSYGSWVIEEEDHEMFEQIISYLSSIDAELDTQTEILNVVSNRLNAISGNVQNIYNLLYDSLHDESSELSSESEAVAEQIMQREDSEQYWNDKNMENYHAIGLDNFSFSSGIVSGISLVGTIFTNLWNALGDYTVIFTFSLTLGVALVVIGRVSRTGGKKGGDDG